MDNPRLEYLREKVKKLPLQPGIYIMKDKRADHLYRQGKGAEKSGQQLFSQRGKTYAEGLSHGGKCMGL